MRSLRNLGLTVALILAVCQPVPLMAQSQTGDILGTIRDPQGLGVPGANITITNQETGAVRTATSDDRGNYLAPGFFPGVYRVEVSSQNFQKAIVPDVRVAVQGKMRVDVDLTLGEITSEVTVTTPIIATEAATVTSVLGRLFMETPPSSISRQGWALDPMAWVGGSSGGGANWRWGGISQIPSTEYQVDGAQDQRELLVPPGSKEEAAVVMGSPSAEYSRPVTANVTFRSGTKKLHGEFYSQLVNPALHAANTPLGPQPRPRGIPQWGFEYNAGGPVYIPKVYDGRDKTFFFFDYYTTLQQKEGGQGITTIPTARMMQGDFSRLRDNQGKQLVITDPFTGQPFPGNIIPTNRITPVAPKVIKDAILGNFGSPLTYVGDPDSYFRNATWDSLGERQFKTWVLKLDHNIGTKHVLSGSWNQYRFTFYKPGMGTGEGGPGFNRFTDAPQRRVNVGHTWVISPKVVNQLRVAETIRGEDNFTPRSYTDRARLLGNDLVKSWGLQGISGNDLSGGPKMAISSGVGVFLDHNTEERGVRERRKQVYDSLSYNTGSHTVKGGASYVRQENDSLQNPNEAFGRYTFTGRFTGVPFADFLLGIPNESSRAASRADVNFRGGELAAYVQDDWRVTPKLTLSYGLRWARIQAPIDAAGLYFNFDPASGKVVVPNQLALDRVSKLWPTNTLPVVLASSLGYPEKLRIPDQQWMPRFGFAYRPLTGSDLVIRSGFGVYNSIFLWDGIQTGGPFALSETVPNELIPGTGSVMVPRYTLPNPFGAASGQARGVATGNSVATNLRSPYVMTWNLSGEKSLFSKRTTLRLSYMGNKSTQLIRTFDLNTPQASSQPFSQSRRPFPAYNQIFRTENGFNAGYNAFELKVIQPLRNGLLMDFSWFLQRAWYNTQAYAWAPRERPIDGSWPTHDVVANFSYDVPFGPEKRWLSNASGAKWLLARVVGGWSTTGVFNWHTGRRATPTYSGYDSLGINQFSGRPDFVSGCDLYTRPQKFVANEPFYNISCFKPPAPGTYGNAPQEMIEGPPMWVLSMAPFKEFRIPGWENGRLRIGASIYNILNNSSFWGPPNGNVGVYRQLADGRFTITPPNFPASMGTNWVRRTGSVEAAFNRKLFFQAYLKF